MSNSDTLSLLKECSAGIKTAVGSIDDVIPFVQEEEMRKILKNSREKHEKLEREIDDELKKMDSSPKEPNAMAKGMSKVKINAEMAFKPTQQQAANLITDGCNMGIKSINKYLNQYPAAEDNVKGYAEKIGKLEEHLSSQMQPYL